MLLFDALSPAPRCLRMYLLEKDLALPTQQVDVMAPAHYVAAMGVLGAVIGFWPLACKGWQPKR